MDGANLFFNLATLSFSLLAVAASTVTALRQSRLMQHSNLLPVVIELFDRFRAEEFKQHMTYISTQLWKDYPPGTTAFEDLPHEARSHVVPVGSFFNLVGVLAANGIISDLMASSYMGASINQAWTYLEPYIRNERGRRQDQNWNLFFEHLAYLTSQLGPAKIDERLKLKRMPVTPRDAD
jgi:hypothetical protein